MLPNVKTGRPDCRLRRAAVLALCALAQPAPAQDYPSQPVKIVVPFVAGGGVDVVARIISPRLSEQLGQPVVIENRGGAGGALGAAAVAQSPPDGYTFLLGTGSTHGTNSSVYAKLSYDPVRDFAPVVQVSSSPLVLIVPTALPVQSVGRPHRARAQQAGRAAASAPTAPAASITWPASCSTRWRRSRPTISRIAAPRRR